MRECKKNNYILIYYRFIIIIIYYDSDFTNCENPPYLFFPISSIPSNLSTFTYYSLGTEKSLNLSSTNEYTSNYHPRSNTFHRLSFYGVNEIFSDYKFNTTTINCSSANIKFCVKDYSSILDTGSLHAVLCSNGESQANYILENSQDLTSFPTCIASGTACSATGFCTFDYTEVSTCSAGSRVFNNMCIPDTYPSDKSTFFGQTIDITDDTKGNFLYRNGAMYYSHQISTPDFSLDIYDSGDLGYSTSNNLQKFLISLWYYPEQYSLRLMNIDVTDANNKLFVFYSEYLYIYINNSKTYLEIKDPSTSAITNIEITSLFETFTYNNWYNIVIYTNSDSDIVIMNGAYSSKITLTNSTNKIQVNKICFVSSNCGFSSVSVLTNGKNKWKPGYYKNIEVYYDTDIDTYKTIRSYYNLTDENLFSSPLNYPYFTNLVRYYPLNGRFADNLLSSTKTISYQKKFNIKDSVTKTEKYSYFGNYLSSLNYNDFNYNYIFSKDRVSGKYDGTNPISIFDCDIGQQNSCQQCNDGFLLSRDNNCALTTNNNYVYRSPLMSEDTVGDSLDLNLPASSVSIDKLSFSIVTKMIHFNADIVDLISISEVFILRFTKTVGSDVNGKLDFIIFTYNSSGPTYTESILATFNNVTSSLYDRWINIRFVVDFNNSAEKYFYYIVDFDNYSYTNNADFPSGVFQFNTSTTIIKISNKFYGLIDNINFGFDDGDTNIELGGEDAIINTTSYAFNTTKSIILNSSSNSSCIDSGLINTDMTHNKYTCIRDYEPIDNYCYLVSTNPYGYNSQNIAVNSFDLLTYSQKFLYQAYHFGLNTVYDKFTGIDIKPLSSSGFIRYKTCSRKNNVYRTNFDYVVRPVGETLSFSLIDIPFPENTSYTTRIVLAYYYSNDLTTSDSIKLMTTHCETNCNISDYTDVIDLNTLTTDTGTTFSKNIYKRLVIELIYNNNKYNLKVGATTGSPFDKLINSNSQDELKLLFKGDAAKIQYLRLVEAEVYAWNDNDSVNYTGETTCNDDCMNGTYCNSGDSTCTKCWPAYDICPQSGFTYDSNNKISPCSYLSTVPNIEFTNGDSIDCPLDYMNIFALGIIEGSTVTDNEVFKIELTPSNYNGYTINFWLFAEELLDNPTTSTNITIHLDTIIKVILARKDSTNILISIVYLNILLDETATVPINTWVNVNIGFSMKEDYINSSNKIIFGFIDYNYFNSSDDYYTYSTSNEKNSFESTLDIESVMRIKDDDHTLSKKFVKVFKAGEKFNFKITRTTTNSGGEFLILRNIVVFGDYLRSRIGD